MKRPLISIIIPVYNAEKYLERCILSITNQTYKNIEIITINDGSKDNSIKILYKLQKLYKNIIIIDKENGGVSSARNIGIEKANGLYVFFVDSDDYIERDCLDKMLTNAIDNDADIVRSNYYFKNKKRVLFKENTIYNMNNKDMRRDVTKRYINSSDFNNVWGQLIKKEIIKKTRFDLEYAMGEDFKFNLELLKNVSIISIITDCLYHYVYNVDGICYNDSYNKTKIKINNICKLYDWLYEDYDKSVVCMSYLKEIAPYFLKINEYKKSNKSNNLLDYLISQRITIKTLKTVKIKWMPKNKYYLIYRLILKQKWGSIGLAYFFIYKPIKHIKMIGNDIYEKNRNCNNN